MKIWLLQDIIKKYKRNKKKKENKRLRESLCGSCKNAHIHCSKCSFGSRFVLIKGSYMDKKWKKEEDGWGSIIDTSM